MLNKALIIPSFQPPVSFPKLVQTLKDLGFSTILIINDGSPAEFDLIFNEAKKYSSQFLILPQNRGKGAALKYGFGYVMKNLPQVTHVLTCDDDGQHDPLDILALAKTQSLDSDQSSVWLGVRDFKGDVPLKSLWGNFIIRYALLPFTRQFIYDTQTGLRCIPVKLLPLLMELPDQRFDFETHSLLTLIKNKVVLKQRPIKTIYFKQNKYTRFRSIKDSASVLKSMFKV